MTQAFIVFAWIIGILLGLASLFYLITGILDRI